MKKTKYKPVSLRRAEARIKDLQRELEIKRIEFSNLKASIRESFGKVANRERDLRDQHHDTARTTWAVSKFASLENTFKADAHGRAFEVLTECLKAVF